MPIWIQIPILPPGTSSGNLGAPIDEDDLDLDIPLLEDEEPQCTCKLDTLICKGCQCGAMQKERASGPQNPLPW